MRVCVFVNFTYCNGFQYEIITDFSEIRNNCDESSTRSQRAARVGLNSIVIEMHRLLQHFKFSVQIKLTTLQLHFQGGQSSGSGQARGQARGRRRGPLAIT